MNTPTPPADPVVAPTVASNGTRRRQSPQQASRTGALDVVPPPEYPARTTKEFDIGATFKIDLGWETDDDGNLILEKGKKIKKVRTTVGYAERTPSVPEINPHYEFPAEETKALLLGLENKDNILIHGHTGVGKSSVITQIAARLNYQMVRVNFDGYITRTDLVGDWVVKGTDMFYMWGLIPIAARMPGTIILLDEADAMNGECGFVFQRILERDDRKLMVTETGGTIIPLHEENLIVATMNTRGMGDDTGLYGSGTRQQNYAQLNRYSLTIQLKYMEEAKERNLLSNMFPNLKTGEVKSLVHATHKIRQAYEANEISVPLSPRDLLNWAEKYGHMGDHIRAARFAFLNRMSPEDAAAAEQVILRAFAPPAPGTKP